MDTGRSSKSVYAGLAGKRCLSREEGAGLGRRSRRRSPDRGARVGFVDMPEEASRALAAQIQKETERRPCLSPATFATSPGMQAAYENPPGMGDIGCRKAINRGAVPVLSESGRPALGSLPPQYRRNPHGPLSGERLRERRPNPLPPPVINTVLPASPAYTDFEDLPYPYVSTASTPAQRRVNPARVATLLIFHNKANLRRTPDRCSKRNSGLHAVQTMQRKQQTKGNRSPQSSGRSCLELHFLTSRP